MSSHTAARKASEHRHGHDAKCGCTNGVASSAFVAATNAGLSIPATSTSAAHALELGERAAHVMAVDDRVRVYIRTGDYAFTTTRPVSALTWIGGVLVQLVEIPGLIEGARSSGAAAKSDATEQANAASCTPTLDRCRCRSTKCLQMMGRTGIEPVTLGLKVRLNELKRTAQG